MVRSFALTDVADRARALRLDDQAAAATGQAPLKKGGFWHKGCPVGLDDLRLLTVTHRGFDGQPHPAS